MVENIISIRALPALPEPGAKISRAQMQDIENGVTVALPSIVEIPIAEEWRRKAKGIEAYLREPEMQRPILGAQRRIEARIGQLLGPAENLGPTTFHHDGRLSELISNHTDRMNYRLLGRALTGECKIEPHEWRKSRRALVALVRERLGLMPDVPDFPEGKFTCLVADPPWKLDTGPDTFAGTGESGHDALEYKQMSIEKIANLKAGRSVADLAAENAHLYLWTTNKYLEASYSIARAWDFKPSVLLTWCKKPRGVGLGDTFRLTTEFVLFCRRGNLPHRKIIPTTWFEWPRGRHSAKPDEFYQLVESVTPSQWPERSDRIDIFARKDREGWMVWGDEVGLDE